MLQGWQIVGQLDIQSYPGATNYREEFCMSLIDGLYIAILLKVEGTYGNAGFVVRPKGVQQN